MNILVTGGAGFIGSHLVSRLAAEGHEVTVIDDFNDYYDPAIKRENVRPFLDCIRLFESDIRNAEEIMRIVREGRFEVIIHLAARAGVRPSIREPRLYLETNITGTFNLLEAARRFGVGRFLFASSSSVYGLTKEVPFREDAPIAQTISPYASTKIACEQLCSSYSHLNRIRMVCLRFFTVYGPCQRPDLAIHQFTQKIYEGRPIDKFGDGSSRRDYTYVDDIIQGVMGGLTYEGPLFDIFNLGESETTSLNDLIAQIEAALGRKAIINHLPDQPGDVPLTCADITKARRLLGYNPTTPISKGIPLFVEWFLSCQKRNG